MEVKKFNSVSPEKMELLFSDLQDDDSLEHHGVIGMHWGIRRYQPYSTRGRLSGKGGKEIGEAKKIKSFRKKNSEIKKARKSDIKKVRTLSDADLAKKLNRIKMEKQFKELTEEDIAPGKKAVKKILVGGAIATGTVVATTGGKYLVRVALSGEQFDTAEWAKYFYPKKK